MITTFEYVFTVESQTMYWNTTARFIQFAIKIVDKEQTSQVPRIRDFRMIALKHNMKSHFKSEGYTDLVRDTKSGRY